MTAEWIRAARAYIKHVDAKMDNGIRLYGRDLVGMFSYPYAMIPRPPMNRCLWCGGETERYNKKWHSTCAKVYLVARGQVRSVFGDLIPDGPCAECGAPILTKRDYRGKKFVHEIDHRLALGVAKRLGDRRSILRAWWIGNLQRLCRACHLTKTRTDRARMAQLDSPQQNLL